MKAFKAAAGFTLIEVMVTVGIVALLASIAYPSYTQYVVRNDRGVGKTRLAEVVSRQESYRADRKGYATTLTELGYPGNTLFVSKSDSITAGVASDSIYSIALAAGASRLAYTLNASPVNSQTRDTDCGMLSITSTGIRSASGPKGTGCW